MTWQADLQSLINAMVVAEGGQEAFVRAVRCSLPDTPDFPAAEQVAKNTILHALWDYMLPTKRSFVDFLGARWAPVGVANDPTNLNANWPKNVKAAWGIREDPPTSSSGGAIGST